MTYVRTTEGWFYLAVVLDLYSRAVIDWALGARLTGDLAQQALTMAIHHRTPTAGLLHHSDRGEPVCRHRVPAPAHDARHDRQYVKTGELLGQCLCQSFFGTLKRELIYHRQYGTRDEATRDIFEYIEVFSHRLRRHSTLGYDSPAEFEARTAVA